MKNKMLLTILVAVGLVIGLVFISKPLEALPPVSWQPEPFDVAVPPGGRLPTKVTVQISRDIPATRVEVTPSLKPYVVSIEPQALPALSRGSEITLTIVFEVATTTPQGTYEGTFHLRQLSGKGNGTQARPLPMVLTVGDLLYPPDPGEAGKETLEGIDSDGDGVRDDIQRYIELTYPEEPAVRAGLRQYSRFLQNSLLESSSKPGSLANDQKGMKARECLRVLMGRDPAYRALMDLRAFAVNTKVRSLAYIEFDSQLGGEVFSYSSINDQESCE